MDLGEGNKEGFLKNIYSYNYSIRLKLFPNGKKEGREEVGGGEKRGGKESGVKGREASKLASIVLRFKKKKRTLVSYLKALWPLPMRSPVGPLMCDPSQKGRASVKCSTHSHDPKLFMTCFVIKKIAGKILFKKYNPKNLLHVWPNLFLARNLRMLPQSSPQSTDCGLWNQN